MKKAIYIFMLMLTILPILEPVVVDAKNLSSMNKQGKDSCSEITADSYDEPQCSDYDVLFYPSGFEEPEVDTKNKVEYYKNGEVGNWLSSNLNPETTGEGYIIEIHETNANYTCSEGDQCAEAQGLYNDFTVSPGQQIYYSFDHIGRKLYASDQQILELDMGKPKPVEEIVDPTEPTLGGDADIVNTDMVTPGQVKRVTGEYTVPEDINELRIAFTGTEANGNVSTAGNGIDDVNFGSRGVYDNIVNIEESNQNDDTCIDDVFTVSNQLNHLQGDIQDDSTITYTFNQPVEVESGTLNVDRTEYPLDANNMTVIGNTVEITNIPEISDGINAENIDVEMDVKPVNPSNPLDLSVESNFDFYSELEKEVNPIPESYSVTDGATIEKECNIPTEITKEIVNESGEIDGEMESNEDLTYRVTLTNQKEVDAINVVVRDSMLENLPEYIEYDGNVVVNPDIGYTGNLSDGTFVLDTVPAESSVEIEYTVHIGEIPDDVEAIGNIVTDNGEDPNTCDITDTEDCTGVEVPTEVDTELTKEVVAESGEIDGQAENNEDITYKITVTNNHTVDAEDVAVRDSMLENLPEYITYDGNVSVNPNVGYTGSLSDGTFVLDTVAANSSIEIEYTVHIGEIPDEVAEVGNIVTDNGEDPNICDITDTENCTGIITPTEVDTKLTKEIVAESGEKVGEAESNEDITYKITVTNNHTVDAEDVAVRDSMLENLPEYIEYDGNVSVNPGVGYTGSLEDGTFVLDTVPAGSSVEIEYTVNIGEIPDDVETVLNIVTDNGDDPSTCVGDSEDCVEVEVPTEVDTELTKEIVAESGEIEGEAESNEDITYKVVVTNNHTVDAENIAVRDSMLENLPEYIEYDGNVSVNPDVEYTGNLSDGTFVLDTVAANSSVEIEYTVNVGEIPTEVETVLNIVTDNEEDPSTCDIADIEDCIEVEIPTGAEPNTELTKEIVAESGEIDGQVEDDEDITYKVTVINKEGLDAEDVAIRDSMLENLPEYIEYDGNVSVNTDVGYTGSLEDGTFVLDTVPAGSSVEIEYTVNVGEIPEDVATVLNAVTDNGEDPSTCDIADIEDCVEVEIPVVEIDEELVDTGKNQDLMSVIIIISTLLIGSIYIKRNISKK